MASDINLEVQDLKQQLKRDKDAGNKISADGTQQQIDNLKQQEDGEKVTKDLETQSTPTKAYVVASVEAMYQAITSELEEPFNLPVGDGGPINNNMPGTGYDGMAVLSTNDMFPGTEASLEADVEPGNSDVADVLSNGLEAAVKESGGTHAKEVILQAANRLTKGKISVSEDSGLDIIQFQAPVSALTFLVELGKSKLQFLTKSPTKTVKNGNDLILTTQLPEGERFSMELDKRGFLKTLAVG